MATANPALPLRPTPGPPGAVPAARGAGLDYKWLVLLCLLPGVTVFLIDATVVNVALAKFGAVFGADVTTVQWAITGFALASAIATPMASYMEGRFTMKRVWVAALAAFTAASVLCGLAPVFWVLVLGRVLQGFAGGMLLPIAISTLFQTFPPEERGQALGFFAIPIVAGPALGPTLGGYLVTNWDWRLVFFINLPIGIAAVVLSVLFLRADAPRVGLRFDAVGAVLSTLAFGVTLYGLSQVHEKGWGSIQVQGLLGVGLFSLVAFTGWELTRDQPLLDMRLFAIPQFLIANVVGWVSTIALFGAEFLLPLYLQNLRGLSAMDTGLLLLPQGLAAGLAGPIAGRLTDRLGARPVVLFGFLLLAFNTWQLSQLTLTTSYYEIRWLLVARGLALGCTLQPTQLVAMAVVPPRLRTNASSLNNAMRGVFQSFGIAMLSTIVATQAVVHTTQLSWQVRADTTQGLFLSQASAALQQAAALPAGTAAPAAVAVVVGQITRQATVLAFGDAYHVTFIAALVAIGLALLLPGRRQAGDDGGGELMAGAH
jgi:MFS transporter, DHA2 family, multidrug resistance protein